MASAEEKLKAAACSQDADAFEEALSDCWECASSSALCEVLVSSLTQDWHTRHEDVVFTIQQLRCGSAINALESRAVNCPAYLEWDTNFALARKCTWALADIGTRDARDALERLAKADNPLVRSFARERLERWVAEMPRKRVS